MRNKWFLLCILLWNISYVQAQTSKVELMFPNAVLTRESYDKVKAALEKTIIQLFRRTGISGMWKLPLKRL